VEGVGADGGAGEGVGKVWVVKSVGEGVAARVTVRWYGIDGIDMCKENGVSQDVVTLVFAGLQKRERGAHFRFAEITGRLATSRESGVIPAEAFT